MLNSVHQSTASHLVLGAGVLLKNFSFDTAQDAGSLRRQAMAALADERCMLGVTREGGRFSCVPRLRSRQAGVRQPWVGSVQCDDWQVRMTGVLIELTPDNMALLLAIGDVRRHGSVTEVTARCEVCGEDHLQNLCWIGRYGSGYVLIELPGALNTAGIVMDIRDQGEAGAAFCFEAFALSPDDQDEAPFRMVFFEGGDTG